MSDWRPFVYGGAASVIAEIGTFPIDTAKTRLQIQGQHVDGCAGQLKYRGMLHAGYRITADEGLRALYSGLSPALLRQATYGTIKIGIYYNLKKILKADVAGDKLHINVVCGAIAGSVSSAIANPTDVLKVRLQSGRSHATNLSMAQAFMDIYYKEGLRGLWRGVGPTAQRAAVVAGVELSVYDVCKSIFVREGGPAKADSKFVHFASSLLAGIAGAVASTPIDVVKTRLMNQRKLKSATGSAAAVGAAASAPAAVAASTHIYQGSLDCLARTVKYEGVLALYKGFIPTWVRLGPWNIIFFMVYEQMKAIY